MIYHTKQFIINYRYDAFVLLSFVVLVLVVVKKKKKKKRTNKFNTKAE